ncbi:hypothetical protein ACFL1A_02865 [Patescibacteria group bacterium]
MRAWFADKHSKLNENSEPVNIAWRLNSPLVPIFNFIGTVVAYIFGNNNAAIWMLVFTASHLIGYLFYRWSTRNERI